MEDMIYKQLFEGLHEFFGYINWVFVIALLLVSWVINVGTKPMDEKRKEKSKKTMALKWKVFITGLLLSGIFALIYPELRTGNELGKLFFGIFTAMGIHEVGIKWFMKSKK